MYRSDHDAALARIAALEADLARDRTDDAAREGKLAKLEATLAKERIELARVEAELAKLRPPKPRPAPVPESPEPPASVRPPTTYLGAVVFFAIVGLLLVIAMATQCNKRKADEPIPPRLTRIPDEIDALIRVAKKRGQEALPGSRLITISAKGVTENGALHPDYGDLEAYFQITVSPPKDPDIDPSVPIGAAPPVVRSPFDDYKCTTLHFRNTAWTEDSSTLGGMCVVGDLFKNESEIEPRCTAASIWARAKSEGAPGGAIAELRLQHGMWHFAIRDQRATFEKIYPDDCDP